MKRVIYIVGISFVVALCVTMLAPLALLSLTSGNSAGGPTEARAIFGSVFLISIAVLVIRVVVRDRRRRDRPASDEMSE